MAGSDKTLICCASFLCSFSNEAAGVFGQIVAAVGVRPSPAAAADGFVIAFAADAFQKFLPAAQMLKHRRVSVYLVEARISYISGVDFHERAGPDITVGLDVNKTTAGGAAMEYFSRQLQQLSFAYAVLP